MPPVAGAADHRVVEMVGPVLQLEIGAVRRAAARVVDPDARRPAGAGPQQRGVQGARGVDGEAGHTPVQQRDGVIVEILCPRRRLLRDGDLGVAEVVDQRGDRRAQLALVAAVDHQHRQRPRVAQVGIRQPHRGQRRVGRHPQPGPAGRGQLTPQLVGVGRVGVGQHGRGEGVAAQPAQHDTHVGQVGVDLEVAVARPVGGAAGGRDARPDQRDQQLPGQRTGRRLRRRHHLSHRQAPEADDGVADLADRHDPRHQARPAQPHQPVGAGELVDGGAAVHPARRLATACGSGCSAAACRSGRAPPPAPRAGPGRPAPAHSSPTSTPPAPWPAGARGLRPGSGATGTPRRRPARYPPGPRRSARGRRRSATPLPRRARRRPPAGSARWRSRCPAAAPTRSPPRPRPAGRPASPATARRGPAS